MEYTLYGVIWILALLLLGAAPVAAAEGPRIDFAAEIAPIFEERCFECHGSDERKGGLRLTNRRDAFLPGETGIPVIEPGHADLSLLYELLLSTDEDERMPKEGSPLSAEEIERIRLWIDQGASWPDGGDPARSHWAYQRPVRPAVPAVQDKHWPRNEIDRFVLARLEAEGLAPSPAAEPARLLRRLHLDLIGLPPTPEQVDAFLADPSPEAYGRIVDELLASPAYGERWASHWLDLARHADSNGFQRDQIYEAWAYRDWVIDAFNRDLPFDQFTIEQIAGDMLDDPSAAQQIATGFHRSATTNVEAGADPEEDRVRQVADRVNVTSTVWLGSTLECAQCHNHKYDPFSQKEYYELFAFFNNTPLEVVPFGEGDVSFNVRGPMISLPPDPATEQRRADLERQMRASRQLLRAGGLAPDFATWKEEMRAALAAPPVWKTATITGFLSSEDETHEVLEDGSVAIDGPVPDSVTHELRLHIPEEAITAFRVEILPRKAGAPLRQPRQRNPPSLSELLVIPWEDGEEQLPVALWSPPSKNFQARAIDGLPGSAWVARLGRHRGVATFLTEEPLGGTQEFALVLDQQAGRGGTLDRVRILYTTSPTIGLQLPPTIASLLERSDLSANENQSLRRFYEKEGRQAYTDLNRLGRARARLKRAHARVMQELPQGRTSHLLKRGNFLTPGDAVEAGTPTVLHPFDDTLPRNRLGLARWLVDPANPLVGRVTVNRWWGELLGHGLVRTPEDLGTRGDPPSHPGLLDWLAVEFVERGWSMKSIHRKIVTSATYQQSSRFPDELRERDPLNVLLARNERRRLPAELVRDNGLAVSGLLHRGRGGPPIYPPQPPGIWNHAGGFVTRYSANRDENRFRRGVYVVWRRSSPHPDLVAFDAPDRTTCTVRRPQTNTPLQALSLLNGQAQVEMSAALAQRILHEGASEDTDGKISHGLRLAVGRMPRPAEITELRRLLDGARARFETDPEGATKLLRSARVPIRDGTDVAALAAWFEVAQVLLNLDETISRT